MKTCKHTDVHLHSVDQGSELDFSISKVQAAFWEGQEVLSCPLVWSSKILRYCPITRV